MRHLNNKIHLNRSASHRKALFGNLSAELFKHRRIVTTLSKAKYTRRYAERMITFARRGDLNARRQVAKYLRNPEALKLLFKDLGPHFKNRNGGYTRIIKIGPRRGDAAPMAILELVGFDDAEAPEVKTASKPASKSRLKAAQDSKTKDTAVEAKSKEVKTADDSQENQAETAASVTETDVKDSVDAGAPEEEKSADDAETQPEVGSESAAEEDKESASDDDEEEETKSS